MVRGQRRSPRAIPEFDWTCRSFISAESRSRRYAPTRHPGHFSEHERLITGRKSHQGPRDGQELNLTRREFDLLSVLARHAGKVVTHKQLLHAVWGPAHEQDTQYLRTYVGQLRQKVEPDPSDPSVVLTEPGIGYRLAEPKEWPDQ